MGLRVPERCRMSGVPDDCGSDTAHATVSSTAIRTALIDTDYLHTHCEWFLPQTERCASTVIPRLTKIIHSGVTFVSRNEILEWSDQSCWLLYVSACIH